MQQANSTAAISDLLRSVPLIAPAGERERAVLLEASWCPHA